MNFGAQLKGTKIQTSSFMDQLEFNKMASSKTFIFFLDFTKEFRERGGYVETAMKWQTLT